MEKNIIAHQIKGIKSGYYQRIDLAWNTFLSKPERKYYLIIKNIMDYFVALIAIIILMPIFILIPIIIKIDSEGPALFKQKRIGKNCKPFYIYKFRTMIKDAHTKQIELQNINEMQGGKLFKSNNDPRITRIGKFLRKYSLDELPQLFNILQGEMSIIGPRPLSTPISAYEKYQLKRFIIKPGLGCIWQAYYRDETKFTKWMKTDLLYVKKISLLFDIKIFLLVAKIVILGKGAR
jgi:lipopolysaccharide/colanic/teichoic acid biosynthesis glycosyltransferase